MYKLELLANLIRAISNNPNAAITFTGPEPSGGGDVVDLKSGWVRHSDLYDASIETAQGRGGYGHAHAKIRKEWDTPKDPRDWGNTAHPDPPTLEECVNALFDDARKQAEALRQKNQDHADLLKNALDMAENVTVP